jgi:hypothetical protein
LSPYILKVINKNTCYNIDNKSPEHGRRLSRRKSLIENPSRIFDTIKGFEHNCDANNEE